MSAEKDVCPQWRLNRLAPQCVIHRPAAEGRFDPRSPEVRVFMRRRWREGMRDMLREYDVPESKIESTIDEFEASMEGIMERLRVETTRDLPPEKGDI